ncbi:MAG TPA: DUF2304 family protein [Candidatus Nanoarchaeia archaeon]|nr:DUF2304 family protein [Candidatus Nanoarchaeia archaeon]
MEIIQVLLIAFVLFALSRAYLRYKEGQIKTGEFAFWIIIWVTAIIAISVPRTVGVLSQTFGIGRPADLIVYVAVTLLFYLIFRMYVALDRVEEKITKVVREVAIQRVKKK